MAKQHKTIHASIKKSNQQLKQQGQQQKQPVSVVKLGKTELRVQTQRRLRNRILNRGH